MTKNLRGEESESRIWADEELRKVNEILGLFGEQYKFKTNLE